MKNIILTFLYILPFLFSGCVTLYKPNTINSPLLKEAGELNVGGALGISGSGLLNLQASYAPINRIGIMINGMYHTRRTSTLNVSDSGIEKLNILAGEIGAGYFKTFGNNKHGLFQCYSGGGFGSANDRIDRFYRPEVSAKYANVFLQPGIGYTGENFDISFDLRGNYVQLYHIYASFYSEFKFWNTDFRYHSDTSLNFVNLEPTVTIRAGGKSLKGVLQLGATIPTINSEAYYSVNTASQLILPLFKFSFGVVYAFRKQE